jgi:four helix bundle protein
VTHRDLRAWQWANSLAADIHRWCDEYWRPARADAITQLRRASLSVSLNIAEGHASGPGRRCKHFLRIAHSSAVETVVLLEFLATLGEETRDLLKRAESSAALSYRLWATARPRSTER